MSATGPLFLVNPAFQVLTKRTGEKPPARLERRVNLSLAGKMLRLVVCDGRSEVTVDLAQPAALRFAKGIADILTAMIPSAPTQVAPPPAKAQRKPRAVGFRPKAEREG